MKKCSKKLYICIFGLIACLLTATPRFLLGDEAVETKKEKKKAGETKVIIDSGLGAFDWTGENNNFQKASTPGRKPISQESELKVVCPACDGKNIPVITLTSQRIALDYDFCEHFVGDSPNNLDLWCCSLCGYTTYRKIFTQPIEDEDKAFVKKFLTDAIHNKVKDEFGNLLKDLKNKPLSQKIIPTSIKIKNFVTFVDHRNDIDEKWKASFYVKAVYAARNNIAIAPSCTSLNFAFIDISKKAEADVKITEKEKQLPHVSAYYLNYYLMAIENYKPESKERIALHILIAQCFNRLGYYSESKKNLAKANEICIKYKDLNDASKIIKDLSEYIDLEKECSIKAISSMKDALEQKLDYGKNQTGIIYLIGELSRRVEMYSDAYLFLSASKMIFPPENPIFSWIEDHLKRKEFKNDEFLLLTPPPYLKQIVLDHKNKK